MLDINLIRENPEYVKKALLKKGWTFDAESFIKKLDLKRDLVKTIDELKAEKNKLSATVPMVKKNGGNIEEIFLKVKEINLLVETKEKELSVMDEEINKIMFELPNMPDDDLLEGEKENNKVVKTFGTKHNFSFKPKDHVELAESLGLIDYTRAAKMSGRGTWVYTNEGARLEWALLNFFIQEHLKDGYQFILPPHIMKYESGFVAGQFPKFAADIFWLEGTEQKKYMLPTAETPLTNFHAEEILQEKDLPKKYFAYTPCYRSEAGSYRTEERGMIRGFQFNKIEMFQYTTEEGSNAAFDELVEKASSLVEKLGLHFQITKLAAGDCSHSMARTFDIEVWIPSMEIYKEVSSVSNARTYQARRGNIKYRDNQTGKTKFCHTLNGSGLATSRVFPAILEQYQNEDGSVTIPEVLVPFMNGQKVIKPKN